MVIASINYLILDNCSVSSSCFLMLSASALGIASLTAFRSGFDKVFCFFQPETGHRTNDLDHLDFLCSAFFKNDRKFRLFF